MNEVPTLGDISTSTTYIADKEYEDESNCSVTTVNDNSEVVEKRSNACENTAESFGKELVLVSVGHPNSNSVISQQQNQTIIGSSVNTDHSEISPTVIELEGRDITGNNYGEEYSSYLNTDYLPLHSGGESGFILPQIGDATSKHEMSYQMDPVSPHLKKIRFLEKIIANQNSQFAQKEDKMKSIVSQLKKVADKSQSYHQKMDIMKQEWHVLKQSNLLYRNQVKLLRQEITSNKVAICELSREVEISSSQIERCRQQQRDILNCITCFFGLQQNSNIDSGSLLDERENSSNMKINASPIDISLVNNKIRNLITIVQDICSVGKDADSELIRQKCLDLQSFFLNFATVKEISIPEENMRPDDHENNSELIITKDTNELISALNSHETAINQNINSLRSELMNLINEEKKGGKVNESQNSGSAEKKDLKSIDAGVTKDGYPDIITLNQLIMLLQDDKTFLKEIICRNESKLAEFHICIQKRIAAEERNKELCSKIKFLEKSLTDANKHTDKLEENYKFQLNQAELKIGELKSDLERTKPYIQKFQNTKESYEQELKKSESIGVKNTALQNENQIKSIKIQNLEKRLSEIIKSSSSTENKRINETDALRSMNYKIGQELKTEIARNLKLEQLNSRYKAFIDNLKERRTDCNNPNNFTNKELDFLDHISDNEEVIYSEHSENENILGSKPLIGNASTNSSKERKKLLIPTCDDKPKNIRKKEESLSLFQESKIMKRKYDQEGHQTPNKTEPFFNKQRRFQ